MNMVYPMQPTLWRTCRALANRRRLEMLRLLMRYPGLTVSAVSRRLHLSLPVTSSYLRALEARGLLTVQRNGRWVKYSPGSTVTSSLTAGLIAAIQATFEGDPHALPHVFKLATAFTHPTRILIIQILRTQPHSLAQLQARTHLSRWALLRHVRKLEARGFIKTMDDFLILAKPSDQLGQALLCLAASKSA